MCEMFAVSAARPLDPVPYLQEFFPDSVWHPHGWGLAWREGDEVRLHKEPVMAAESALLEGLLETGLMSPLLIAHIRNATRGVMSYENCHPFVMRDVSGRTWVVAHNGTMLSDALIEPFRADQRGTTDSERLALFLTNRMNEAIAQKGRPLDCDERFAVLDEAIVELAPDNKLNLVIEDGECLYAHTNTDQPTLYEWCGDNLVLLCTRPLDVRGWGPVPSCQLIAYCNGCVASRGTMHGSSFDNDLYLRIISQERFSH